MTTTFKQKIKSWERRKGELEDGIYFTENSDGSTHYISVKNKKIKDPYKYYQFPKSHGFCQLFAFFLHINDESDFKKINFSNKVTMNNFEKYVYNSFECLQKFIKILKDSKYKTVRNAMRKDFNEMDKEEYGIKENTSFTKFVNDMEKIPIENVLMTISEDIDYFILEDTENEKYNEQLSKKILKKYEKKIPLFRLVNSQLCVQPTGNESQFEAFQSIIAYSLSADEESPYYKLLQLHNIRLIEKDINELIAL